MIDIQERFPPGRYHIMLTANIGLIIVDIKQVIFKYNGGVALMIEEDGTIYNFDNITMIKLISPA